MIQRASFRNFKALREVDVTFDSRLTVLVGPNGSGKSSVLQGIHAMGQAAAAAAANSAPDPRHLLRYLTRGADPQSFRLSVEERSPSEGVHSLTATGRGGEMVDGAFRLGFSAETPRPAAGPCPPAPPSTSFPRLRTTAFLHLDARRLAAPSSADRFPPRMEPDGGNLPSVLGYLKSYHPASHAAVTSAVRRLVPDLAGLRTEYSPGGDLDYLVLDYAAAAGVPATLASTGTLLALGLLTALHHPQRPAVLLCDDLDSGLHPKAQMELIAVLRELIDRNPDLQIIATSHSPYILDKLEWNEVRVTSLDDGAAACRPLTDHPRYGRWHDAMSPGEFWSHAGEEWVTKAPAAVAP